MTTILHNVHLVSPDEGTVRAPVDVTFSDTITSVTEAAPELPEGAVDCTGQFLMPGLVDTHAHLGTVQPLRDAVAAGITTVVELGTHPDSLVGQLREQDGVPRILSAGSAASAPGSNQIARMGFPEESGVTGPADAERYLDWRTEHGVDLIKIIVEDPAATDVPALEPETLAALVRGAHERGLLTVGHVVTAAAFDRGLDAGIDILTHAPLDAPLAESTVTRMVQQGTIASPTLIMMRTMARARLGEHADAAFRNALESVRSMHAAGVSIIAGTDANEVPQMSVPLGSSLHEELELLGKAGLDSVDVLRAATTEAARALGLTERADLVLLESDPLMNPAALRTPVGVWVAGERLI